jgi:general secretion pathway protein I
MRNARGFTLLEVMIALIILAGGLLVLNTSWSTNNLRIRKANLYTNSATLLQKKMIELEAYYKDKSLEEIPETDAGDFGTDQPRFRWEMKSRELKFPDLSALIIGEGNGDETLLSMIRQMTDLISKSIKEVKVTIFVKTEKKEASFSATTYFVDYSKGIGVPGAAGGGQ